MDEQDILCLTAWTKTQTYKNRIQIAKEKIKESFAICLNPYLSLSGGKDSIAMLALTEEIATEINRDYVIWSHVSDASFPGTMETINKCVEKTRRKLILEQSEISAFEILKDRFACQQFGKTGVFFDSIKKVEKIYNFDLAFVGVRAHESKRRMEAFKAHGFVFDSRGIKISNPIALLKTEDVFSVALQYDYPIHPVYYKKHPSGDYKNIRLGYLTAQDLLHKGTLSFIKYNYPEQYQKIITARPEFSCYV